MLPRTLSCASSAPASSACERASRPRASGVAEASRARPAAAARSPRSRAGRPAPKPRRGRAGLGPDEWGAVDVRRLQATDSGCVVAQADLEHAERVGGEGRLTRRAPVGRVARDCCCGLSSSRLLAAQCLGDDVMGAGRRDDGGVVRHLPQLLRLGVRRPRRREPPARGHPRRRCGTRALRPVGPGRRSDGLRRSRCLVSRSTAVSSRRSAAEMAASSRRRRATSGSTSPRRKALMAPRMGGTPAA